MKKVILTSAAAVMVAAGASAQSGSWRKSEAPPARKHSITAHFSPLVLFDSGDGLGAIGLEYDRALPHNLSVGAVGLYAPLYKTRRYDGTYWFASVRAGYTLPVIRGWLYFRVGAGIGIGVQPGYFTQGDTPEVFYIRTRVDPHMIIDANWVLRVSRRVDLRFSPLVVYPSQYIFGLGSSPYSRFEYINMFPVGATVRF